MIEEEGSRLGGKEQTMSVSAKAIEQLSRGNPRYWLDEKAKQLAEANVHLHSVSGIQELGQVQGRAAALQEMVKEFELAGFTPG
jgi:hypothetical protein